MIYTSKILREGGVSPEDVINTPKEIGAELTEIEKAICGPDGIEAHRDEVEAAQTGVVGEPLEEAFNMIYEAEYNYNQIMRCIGINELKSYNEGKEFVFTEADKTGFFESFKTWLKKAFEKVVEFFKNIIASLTEMVGADKKFVKLHDVEIKAGYAKLVEKGEATVETYSFANLGDTVEAIKASDYFKQDAPMDHYEIMKQDLEGNSENSSVPERREADSLDRMGVFKICEKDTNMGNLTERLTGYLRGEKATVKIGEDDKLSAEAVIGRLSAELIGAVKAEFARIKGLYADRIKLVDDMRRIVSKDEDEATASKKIAICESFMADVRHDLRVENIKCAVYMSALKARAARDRSLAHKYYIAGKKPEKKEQSAPAANHESAPISSVIFSSMQFV